MKQENKWTVRVFGVSFNAGTRQEKPLEEFTQQELKQIVEKRNREALMAAGYSKVDSQHAMVGM